MPPDTELAMNTAPALAVSTRFRVTLHCPTPVAHPELEVEAEDEAAAWRQFCRANGISDSEHKRTIVGL